MRTDTPGFSITLDVEGHEVLLVGDPGDPDVPRKRALLEAAGARVTELAPAAFSDAAVTTKLRLVMLTTREPELAARVSAAARARQIPVWCSDAPPLSDFAMPAVAQVGPVRLAISTAGGSPTLAGRMRAAFEQQLDERFRAFGRALAERRPTRTMDERRADLDGFELEVRVRYPAWFKDV